jgi:hypothetical protein
MYILFDFYLIEIYWWRRQTASSNPVTGEISLWNRLVPSFTYFPQDLRWIKSWSQACETICIGLNDRTAWLTSKRVCRTIKPADKLGLNPIRHPSGWLHPPLIPRELPRPSRCDIQRFLRVKKVLPSERHLTYKVTFREEIPRPKKPKATISINLSPQAASALPPQARKLVNRWIGLP